jgi:diacylglycerol kinase family enzyme
MMVTHLSFDPSKTEIYQAASLDVKSKKRAHFQVDGEYLGKVNRITANILPKALKMIVP